MSTGLPVVSSESRYLPQNVQCPPAAIHTRLATASGTFVRFPSGSSAVSYEPVPPEACPATGLLCCPPRSPRAWHRRHDSVLRSPRSPASTVGSRCESRPYES